MSNLKTNVSLASADGDGNALSPDPVTGLVTLDADDHYFPLPAADGKMMSVQIFTGAAIEGTFTIESTNMPARLAGGVGAADVAFYSETAGHWQPVNNAALGLAQTSGTGWTATVLSLAKTAGAGGAIVHLFDPACARYRVKAVVTTPGTVRVVANGKD